MPAPTILTDKRLKRDSCQVQFWSSTEYGAFMTGLVEALRDLGWDASHRFHVSEQAYRGARSKLARLWLRVRMYLIYPLALLWHLFRARKPLIAVVTTNTFYAPWLAAFLARRGGIRVIHLVYDLYPEALYVSGHLKEGSRVARLLTAIVDSTLKSCDANVFLGDHLLQVARERHAEIPKATVLPVGASGEAFPNPPAKHPADTPLTILYCGNLGRMHDTETLLATLREGADELAGKFRFLFHSTGPGLEAFRQKVAALPECIRADVVLAPNLPHDQWVETMAAAPIGLVTMIPGAERVVMPSKTYSAMMAGQAILAICPRRSDLAETVLAHDCGWVVEPGSCSAFGAVLITLASDAAAVAGKRMNAFRAAHERFGDRKVAEDWSELCGGLDLKSNTSVAA